ncbi:MAG TPA: hypothetical protein VFP22_07275, partial [Candidatus Limnocylindrales bacterium]|nr:hypothetical protein [Candidatus Limnocylindrales bacterium]
MSITPSANPDGSIQIADNVVLVGQSAAYSPSGDWFAFTARPADGSTGPDIFLWKVGEPEAHAVTSDHASVFGSWVGEVVVASTVAQAPGDPPVASGSPAAVPSQPSAGPLLGTSFLLDPTTGHRIEIARGERTWRPTVDPSGHRAVYWTGSLQRAANAPVYVPADGRLVIGDWDVATSGTSVSPSGASGSPSGAGPSDGSASRVGASRCRVIPRDWAAPSKHRSNHRSPRTRL